MVFSSIAPFADLLHNITGMMLPEYPTMVAVETVRPAAWIYLDIRLYVVVRSLYDVLRLST